MDLRNRNKSGNFRSGSRMSGQTSTKNSKNKNITSKSRKKSMKEMEENKMKNSCLINSRQGKYENMYQAYRSSTNMSNYASTTKSTYTHLRSPTELKQSKNEILNITTPSMTPGVNECKYQVIN